MTGLIVIRHTKLQKFTFYSFWRLVECAVCMQSKHSRKEFSSSSVQRRRTAASRWSCTNTSHNWTEYELRRYEEVRRWLQLWFDFDSTLVRRERRTAYQRSSSAKWRNRLAAASHSGRTIYWRRGAAERARVRDIMASNAFAPSNHSRTTVES